MKCWIQKRFDKYYYLLGEDKKSQFRIQIPISEQILHLERGMIPKILALEVSNRCDIGFSEELVKKISDAIDRYSFFSYFSSLVEQ